MLFRSVPDVTVVEDGGQTPDVPVNPDGGGSCPAAGEVLCNGACVDTSSNPMNCGTCGNACGMGQVFSSGT